MITLCWGASLLLPSPLTECPRKGDISLLIPLLVGVRTWYYRQITLGPEGLLDRRGGYFMVPEAGGIAGGGIVPVAPDTSAEGAPCGKGDDGDTGGRLGAAAGALSPSPLPQPCEDGGLYLAYQVG